MTTVSASEHARDAPLCLPEAAGWARIEADLDAQGWARLPDLLSARKCEMLRTLYTHPELFRSRVLMQRHGYGRGEYQYFAYPLPAPVRELRTELYARLAPLANRWQGALRSELHYPAAHAEFVERCHRAGQQRPTPLLLKYQTGDYNCLHQDLYGEHVFPLQVAVLLSRPQQEFGGGEFVITEQRPRMQSRASVVPLMQGDAVVFAVERRPVRGSKGSYRVNMRHGVSTLSHGERYTLGVIFHDAT